jgi:hypothetical protein
MINMRKIHIGTEIFEYLIIKQRVKIFFPDGKKICPDFSEITGRNWIDIERDSYDRDFSVTPSDIKTYINAYILKNKMEIKSTK